MNHRPPTRVDIGRTVEVRSEDVVPDWKPAILQGIEYRAEHPTYYRANYDRFYTECRVPYTCPDPEAELSILADEMAMAGHDEASKILGLFAAMDNTQRAHVLRMIEERDPALNPIDFRLRNEYGILHFDRRSLYRPS